jgi:hypothetical protein
MMDRRGLCGQCLPFRCRCLLLLLLKCFELLLSLHLLHEGRRRGRKWQVLSMFSMCA